MTDGPIEIGRKKERKERRGRGGGGEFGDREEIGILHIILSGLRYSGNCAVFQILSPLF